jgi:hypothetical protein
LLEEKMKYPDYYGTHGVREICHAAKEGSLEEREHALRAMAAHIASLSILHQGDLLVPAPQRTGKAEYTLELASLLARMTGAVVLDVVACVPHAGAYETKLAGLEPHVEFFLTGTVPKNGRLFMVDNVMATGATFSAMDMLLGGRLMPLPYAVDYTKLEDPAVIAKIRACEK